jgi:hypothetical protein
LQVLLKWLPKAPAAANAGEILAGLETKASLFATTADGLYHHWDNLKRQWRMPPFAVAAAVDVLATGTYARLPHCIKASAPQAVPTAAEETSAITWLNHQLHLRLVKDKLPDGLHSCRIAKGRLWLKKNNLFEISLTLHGPEPDAPWRLLSLDVLVTNPMGAGSSDARALFQDQRFAVLQIVEERLAARHVPDPLLFAVRCLHFFCIALQLTVMTTQAYMLAAGRMRNELGVKVMAGLSLELVYWQHPAAGGKPDQGAPAREGRGISGGMGGGGGRVAATPIPPFSSLKVELIQEATTPETAGSAAPPSGNEGQSLLRVVHTPPILDPTTGYPFDFAAVCTAVSVPLLLDRAMQLQAHHQLKRIDTELAEAAKGSQARRFEEGLGACQEAKIVFQFTRSNQTSEHSSSGDGVSSSSSSDIVLTYGSEGFAFYENGQQTVQQSGTGSATVDAASLAEASLALNSGSAAVDVIRRLHSRVIVTDLARQSRMLGLDAIRTQQPLIPRATHAPESVLHLRFRKYDNFILVVEVQGDGQETFQLVQSESSTESPLLRTKYTPLDITRNGIGSTNGEEQGDVDPEERSAKRMRLLQENGDAPPRCLDDAAQLCLKQIPMVLLSQQLSAMNFNFTLDEAGARAIIHHHAVISGKLLYTDVESMQFVVRDAECRVELTFAEGSICGSPSPATIAIIGHDNVTYCKATRQVVFKYNDVNTCVGGFFFHFENACYLFELVTQLPTPGSEVASLWPLPKGFDCEFAFTYLSFSYGGGHRALLEWRPDHQFYSVELSTTLPGRNPHSQVARQLSNELYGHLDINELLAALALTLHPLTSLQSCTKFEEEISFMPRTSTTGLLVYKSMFAIDLAFMSDGSVTIQGGEPKEEAAQLGGWRSVPNLAAFIEKFGPVKVDATSNRIEVPRNTFRSVCSVPAGKPHCPLHDFVAAHFAKDLEDNT